jgi:hypothetical protein
MKGKGGKMSYKETRILDCGQMNATQKKLKKMQEQNIFWLCLY